MNQLVRLALMKDMWSVTDMRIIIYGGTADEHAVFFPFSKLCFFIGESVFYFLFPWFILPSLILCLQLPGFLIERHCFEDEPYTLSIFCWRL